MTFQKNWGVIFDVDGTMVDNLKYHQQAWIEIGRRYSLNITPEFYRAKIHSRSNDWIVSSLFTDKIEPELVEKIGEEKEAVYRQLFRPVVKEVPGLTSLLKQLKSCAVPCVAASNSPIENINMVLNELDIRKYFIAVITYMDVAKGKPDPQIFLAAAQKLALPPKHCLIIEDSVSGFQAAENAQMPYIVITAGADENELKAAGSAKAFYKDFTKITPGELYTLIT